AACEAREPTACLLLGRIERDTDLSGERAEHLTRAREHFTRACALDLASACTHLGQLYRDGVGVEIDLDDAQRQFTRACELGDALGCHQLQ
ncbi:MAG: sel1 repeat family protein, partial [Planctomycetaceae bacterium]|nr:sel1 repeat family protein [Planctomycetaceae bacterium]